MQLEDKDLECLILWPKGTQGWQSDKDLLTVLNALCKARGYGAVAQIVTWIEELWRNPNKKQWFENQRQAHLKSLGQEDDFSYHWCVTDSWVKGEYKNCPSCSNKS